MTGLLLLNPDSTVGDKTPADPTVTLLLTPTLTPRRNKAVGWFMAASYDPGARRFLSPTGDNVRSRTDFTALWMGG